VLRFNPGPLRLGAIISASTLALALLGGLGALLWQRRKSPQRHRDHRGTKS
jgi:hypothetical protein